MIRRSTKERAKGRAQEVKGSAKEKIGTKMGRPDIQDRGTAERVQGKVQRKVGEIRRVFGK
jgi:uncharacterized protein YjbJ (UPF0337 family)